MTANRIPALVGIFGFVFLVQEALLNRVNFLLGGFSLYLAFFVAWVMQEERNTAIVTGFIAGFIADLSPTLEAPFGLWTFVLTVLSYVLVNNIKPALDSQISPMSLSLIAVFGSLAALFTFLICGAILGQELGSATYIFRQLLGNSLWGLLLSPAYAPLAIKLHQISLTARSR